jgi:hypothetical protein
MQRIVKAYEDITMIEATSPDNQQAISAVYSVRVESDPASTQRFGDMGAADIYFEELVLRHLGL